MQNAPIFFTIGQIRFNPILDMHIHVEALQAEFRRLGFSGYAEDNVPSIQIDLSNGSPQAVTTNQRRWKFTNSKKTGELVLFSNSISYQTTNYLTSDNFKSYLIDAIKVVHAKLNLDYVEQIGFRTLDAVIPTKDRPLQALLKPELTGFYSLASENLRHSILEGVYDLPHSSILVQRVVITKGQLATPIDLHPMALQINESFTGVNDWHAILDTDCATREQFSFDLQEIENRLSMVKEEASRAFRGAASDQAFELWG